MIFLLFFSMFLCHPGHLNSNELPVNGTVYYNISGTICTRADNARDIVDRESDVYKEITGNLTRGVYLTAVFHFNHIVAFSFKSKIRYDTVEVENGLYTPGASCSKFKSYFPHGVSWLNYTVTVTELFIWPTFLAEYRNVHNLSFVIIAQHKFQTTTYGQKHRASEFLRLAFWYHVHRLKDDEGYVTSEGLRIKYKSRIHKLPEHMITNITNNYMAFITKIKNSYGDGRIPTKPLSGNSSKQGSYNFTVTGIASGGPHEISYIAYIGITLSMIGLFITMTSICFFRRLRKFRRNQILVHICGTVMAGMLLSIISFTYKGDNIYCTAVAQLLHYFILAALSWMCVEAYNLYRDLVKVFNTNSLSCRTFTLRACIFGYGLPALIVCLTSLVDISVYGRRKDACWMTSLAFVVSFLGPVLLIVAINIIFFSLIMREIIQVSQRDENIIRPSLRAAVSLSVVFGFCWLLAGISTFTTNPFVTYAFVIMSSFQGLFIFIFHGIGKQELRDSWKSLPIFHWKFNKFTNTESQGRGKTESTTQDTPQVSQRHSTTKAGKPSNDCISGFDSGSRLACDAGYNHEAYMSENELSTRPYNIPNVPEIEHDPLKKVDSNC